MLKLPEISTQINKTNELAPIGFFIHKINKFYLDRHIEFTKRIYTHRKIGGRIQIERIAKACIKQVLCLDFIVFQEIMKLSRNCSEIPVLYSL